MVSVPHPIPDAALHSVGKPEVRELTMVTEEGSEVSLVNGDLHSEHIGSDLGPGCEPIQGSRNVNIESLYEVSPVQIAVYLRNKLLCTSVSSSRY